MGLGPISDLIIPYSPVGICVKINKVKSWPSLVKVASWATTRRFPFLDIVPRMPTFFIEERF